MRPLFLSAVIATALLLPATPASATTDPATAHPATAADYTVPRSATSSASARGSDAAIELAASYARGAVVAVGVDCVGWRYSIVKLVEHPSTSLYSATVAASATCVQ
ncbi:hypothetical protein ABZ816_03335 [Actinosynnema sp. NPDC047251]|uniref:Secreted protein n=1 Tax=Saccharothrix espanaensis (strain ATCC 51144 / DSM 44229 / JCM 9112 / NBRC 15066 / NRRL 15764) TaxID=1179773 RepID=K0K328_SACES|nr:hypothetical protein [Saccharothrix espanaensis]CCH31289.1 hypothetical protein BN6_40020 [Saccharothrix espanaensis DSM 44229]